MLAGISLAVIALFPVMAGATADGIDPADETMLMFVGETATVATVASRQPESPAAAPAMVTVVGREEIERHGYQTLAELLAFQPGFFTATGGRGTAPYLRGLRDSVLFLYDGVPITTDVTKGFAPLDQEISLVAVDRVEIVRGPGSVLWGPDAFAGVVNIVPLRGRQRPGVETTLQAGTDDRRGATVTWGGQAGNGDAFVALSGNRSQFHPSDFTVQQSDGTSASDTVDLSDAVELVGTLHYGEWLHVSGRWSNFNRRYTMRNATGEISWPGEKEAPFNLLKATASKIIGPSHYTLSGFIQELDYRVRDADIERRQRNLVNHLELLWDRRLLARSLLTVGASWRRNTVDGALIRDGFLPDFLAPEDPLFVPQIDQQDYANELVSLFSQFRCQWAGAEWWLGGRLDDHTQYRSTFSYSLGFNRPLGEELRFKAAFGNAFRSPYSSQLFAGASFEPESIQTVSAQFAWSPGAGRQAELTFFHSRIEDHRVEDPYGGLSIPAGRELSGMELAGNLPLGQAVGLFGDISLVSGGGEEHFSSLLFTIIRPDDSRIPVFEEWDEPVDQGPCWLMNLGLNWRIGPAHNLQLSGRIGGSMDFSYQKDAEEGSYSHPLLLDLVYRRPGFSLDHDSFLLKITNLLDQDYLQPDLYGPAEGEPVSAFLVWQYRF